MHARHSTQINDNSEEIKDLHAKFDASVETFCEHLSAETQARKALAQRIAEMQRVAEQQGWSESIVREPGPLGLCWPAGTHRPGPRGLPRHESSRSLQQTRAAFVTSSTVSLIRATGSTY